MRKHIYQKKGHSKDAEFPLRKSEIVERHSGKKLLLNEGRFLHRSESAQGCISNSEKTSRYPNVCGKAHGAVGREPVCGEVGDYGLIQTLLNRKSDYTEGDQIQRLLASLI